MTGKSWIAASFEVYVSPFINLSIIWITDCFISLTFTNDKIFLMESTAYMILMSVFSFSKFKSLPYPWQWFLQFRKVSPMVWTNEERTKVLRPGLGNCRLIAWPAQWGSLPHHPLSPWYRARVHSLFFLYLKLLRLLTNFQQRSLCNKHGKMVSWEHIQVDLPFLFVIRFQFIDEDCDWVQSIFGVCLSFGHCLIIIMCFKILFEITLIFFR